MDKIDKIEHIKIVVRAERNEHYFNDEDWYKKPIDNIRILDKIFINSTNEEKEKIIAVLLFFVNSETCYLNFEFLIKKRRFDEAFNLLKSQNKNGRALLILYHCFARINFILEYDNKLTLEEIEELHKYLSEVDVPFKRIRSLGDENNFDIKVSNLKDSTIARLELIASTLVDKIYSGQIYTEDIESIELMIGEFKLDKKFSSALFTIKNAQPKDEHEYAKDSVFVRTFLESIIIDIAKKIANKSQERIPKIPKESELVDCKSYLKSKGVIDENEKRLIDAIYSILSADSGSHVLTTPREKYRLLVNVTIEMLTLFLANVKSKKLL